jgi:hypothetical protein
MQGHVMPSFPHTLIGLGPFADLGCSIIFIKTAVNVIDPDGQSILEGWGEQDGPRLWHFPLKANKTSLPMTALLKNNEEPGPLVSTASFFLPPPATPIQRPASPLPTPPPPTVVPPPTPSAGCTSSAPSASQPRRPGHHRKRGSLLSLIPLQGRSSHGHGGPGIQHRV